jgi:Cyclic nucleotide-binding domain
MPLIPDIAVFQRKLATLPLTSYQAGETVLSAASTTGRLLILKEGAVAVVKEGIEIARVTEPGAVFGELSVLLDQPHSADVRAILAVSRRRCGHHTQDRPDRAPLRCNGPGAASRQRQQGPPRTKAPSSGRRAGQRNWENGREDRRAAGRHRCQSYVCRLSL